MKKLLLTFLILTFSFVCSNNAFALSPMPSPPADLKFYPPAPQGYDRYYFIMYNNEQLEGKKIQIIASKLMNVPSNVTSCTADIEEKHVPALQEPALFISNTKVQSSEKNLPLKDKEVFIVGIPDQVWTANKLQVIYVPEGFKVSYKFADKENSAVIGAQIDNNNPDGKNFNFGLE